MKSFCPEIILHVYVRMVDIQFSSRVTMLGEEGIEPSERMLVLSDPPVRSILR
jgi:hypothetical protein